MPSSWPTARRWPGSTLELAEPAVTAGAAPTRVELVLPGA